MLVNLSLSPGYRLKITRASRMSELAALEAQMQAKLEALTRINEDLTRRLRTKEKA